MDPLPVTILKEHIFEFCFAYFYGIVIGHFCISNIINLLWEIQNKNENENKSMRPREQSIKTISGILGFIERTLYIQALNFNVFAFIPVWLTLKTVSQWDTWKKGVGRVYFNIFLIGSGLNLIFSFSSFLIIKIILDIPDESQCLLITASALFPVLLTIIIDIWAYCCLSENKSFIGFFHQFLGLIKRQ